MGRGQWEKGASSAGTMSRLSDAEVAEMFDGVGGVPEPVQYGIAIGDEERLREQQGGFDDAFGRAMMNYRSDIQNPMLTGGARRIRKSRKTRKSRNSKPKNWRLKLTASIRLRHRQQRRQ